ncbi:MAG: DNA polymerase III subunit beta [Candidatus Sungbacteria bacterium RIFCSPLOWO2_02_FULL_54_10]|uniref:Beta sliding clamp n=2 Tax=Candidatus Sungiibacteriota TaxID=1817917 RepID=A0A1G2L7B7_9BACT|nr:MAG: DNA polymerase III subunit beta [Candidatus Sungbacteria bacterium RIFCSPHIGHO2_01_FULL_54_26]OHA02897.1 MAG: DNA polymerase III subunit beta [Candidatus Sungbacteria bacterium RIFCSPHIGHO2_02_FULL_53_17]OHA07535.1 MAG: DNA polymerase III subunit beta [Candidatus Sungbacteria bacterium RIFCSPLOWO2_01_FULL_54_21]OHA13054.1 MAG: DNA polymerase III subunit beta [Candidatus Sungbacteria bacterium RIFCSPLOWO2_02_FULL_54_10]
MKFSCTKSDLERASVIAERFTGKQTALPILGHVLLAAQGNVLTLTATNLEHAVELRVPARVTKEGRASVPAKVFASVLQSLGDGEVWGEGERGNLHLRTNARESRLNGSVVDDFPLVPKVKKTATFSVDAASLARALAHVLPAVSASEFKPELSGVFFRPGKQELTLAATDTFRLAESVVPLAKNEPGAESPFIMPHRSAAELSRILDGEDGMVRIAVGDNQMSAETGGGLLTSRLIEGSFPDYKAIIPTRFATSAYLSREDVTRGVRAASIFASKLSEINVRVGQKQIEIKAANPDVGEYRTEYPASLNGKEIAMSFNWRYFLDGVTQLDDEEMFFGCNEASSPALIRNKSHGAFTYVVMPIRLT